MQQAAAALAAPSAPVEEGINAERLAAMIDHTLLKPEATPAMIDQLCAEARTHGFASVCVNACYVSQCRRDLEGSPVLVCTVAGFPLGATSTATKAFEARQAIFEGAREIDMVINVGWLKGGEYAAVREDVAAVVRACHAHGALCKVIIEAALLTEEEKVAACLLAADASADFVKTSTGFGPGGARVEDVRLMRAVVGPEMGIKAAGGIRDYATALAMVRAGATRIGASSSIQIVAGAPRSERVTD
ncbi:MAG: deoxyribose-phosphate aldolase [Chloroflexi bacterium]|nr:deoxyribose-phosphate aldolase [Chloroflexota bacterium]